MTLKAKKPTAIFRHIGGALSGRVIRSETGEEKTPKKTYIQYHKGGSYTVVHPYKEEHPYSSCLYERLTDQNGNMLTIVRDTDSGRPQRYLVHNGQHSLLENGVLHVQNPPYGLLEFYTKNGLHVTHDRDLCPEQQSLKARAIQTSQNKRRKYNWHISRYTQDGSLLFEEIRPDTPSLYNEYGIPQLSRSEDSLMEPES